MNKLILTGSLMAVILNLAAIASADRDPGPYVTFTSEGHDFACFVTRITCTDDSPSCELTVDDTCFMTLSECLGSTFVNGNDGAEAPVLGCSPDAKTMDVDRTDAGL